MTGSRHIRLSEVLRYLGHTGQSIDPELQERLATTVRRCETELEPRFLWEAFDLEPAPPSGAPRRLAGAALALEGAAMEHYLEGAEKVALLACTLGARSEQALRVLGATDPLGQLMYDAACTDLVEVAADEAQAQVEAYAANLGMRCGMRYSPGYGDFDLEVQGRLLEVLQAPKRLGVTATADHLLIPSKSVTAVVALYPAEGADAAPRGRELLGCDACSLCATCQIRARGQRCHRFD